MHASLLTDPCGLGAALLALAAPLAAGASDVSGALRWLDRTDPGARHQHRAVLDTLRGRMLVFGGNLADGGTYGWDGTRWSRLAGSGPAARDSHGLVYDAARDRVVLFGGVASGGIGFPAYMGDTWEWDGRAWALVAADGPSGRERHAMAYDEHRGRTVLFGGTAADAKGGVVYHDDTWEWDGASWTRVLAVGPTPRHDAVMAYDPVRRSVLLFGGADGNDYLGETWEFDGAAWRLLSVAGPSGRIGHSLAHDGGGVLLVGGMTPFGVSLDDTWRWDGAAWSQIASGGPSARRFASLVHDPAAGRALLFGGVSSDQLPFGELWLWDGAAWSPAGSAGPRGRQGHAQAFDAQRGVTLLFGGRVSPFSHDDETWEYDGRTWAHRASTGPEKRAHHALAYDALRRRTVLFGGQDNSFTSGLGDTWEWDGARWILRSTRGPSPRYSHALAYDEARGRTVLFGGWDGTRFLGDTWEWDGWTWTRRATTGPTPRFEHALAFDPLRGRTVLFGGSTSSDGVHDEYLGDTWEWDGASWRAVADAGPGVRRGMAMAFDRGRGALVVHGGITPGHGGLELLSDTWAWDGRAWLRRSTSGPSARYVTRMSYDSWRGHLVLFGGAGETDEFLRDLWEVLPPPRVRPR